MNKTNRNDAHVLLDLYKRSRMPESYLPPDDVREARNICRNIYFLVRQRTAVKNRIRDQSHRLGIDFSIIADQDLCRIAGIKLIHPINTFSLSCTIPPVQAIRCT